MHTGYCNNNSVPVFNDVNYSHFLITTMYEPLQEKTICFNISKMHFIDADWKENVDE